MKLSTLQTTWMRTPGTVRVKYLGTNTLKVQCMLMCKTLHLLPKADQFWADSRWKSASVNHRSVLGDHTITGYRLNYSQLGNSRLPRITHQLDNTHQSDNTARIARQSDNTRQSEDTARIARQSENTCHSENTRQSANQRSWRDVAAKPITICAK